MLNIVEFQLYAGGKDMQASVGINPRHVISIRRPQEDNIDDPEAAIVIRTIIKTVDGESFIVQGSPSETKLRLSGAA